MKSCRISIINSTVRHTVPKAKTSDPASRKESDPWPEFWCPHLETPCHPKAMSLNLLNQTLREAHRRDPAVDDTTPCVTYYTTIIPRFWVREVLQELCHRQWHPCASSPKLAWKPMEGPTKGRVILQGDCLHPKEQKSLLSNSEGQTSALH